MKKFLSLFLSLILSLSIVTSIPVNTLAAKLATPKLISVTNKTDGIKLDWKNVSRASSYYVYKKTDSQKSWKRVKIVSKSEYIDKNVTSGKTYKYTVKAKNSGSLSNFNNTGLKIKRLATPSSLKATNLPASVKVTWKKVNGATSYKVYRKLSTAKSWSLIKTVTGTTYLDKTVKNNSTYNYRVRAAYGKTLSGYSYSGVKIKFINTAHKANLSSIPAFNGEPYIAVNKNIPGLTVADRTSKYFEKYSALDKLGRCGVAFACLGPETLPTEERENISSIKPSGWQSVQYDCVDGKYLYNRCHLIGYQLSAENANERNLITGTRFLNVDGMLPFENMVADYINETGNHVLYRVTPLFKGTELVARGVQIEAYSVEDKGDGICFNVFCYNNQPGITINYANGKSSEDSSVDNEPSTPSEKCDYILNTNSKKFHYPDCGSAASISDANRDEFTGSRDELIKMGYSPCGNCDP